jgi:hypothetical protein
MDRKCGATVLIVALLACGAVQAADWVEVGKGAGNYKELVDTSSISIDGPIRRASTKIIYEPHTAHDHMFRYEPHAVNGQVQYEKKYSSPTHAAYDLSVTAVNCKDYLHRYESLTTYYEDGSNEVIDPRLLNWEPVSPDTTQDRLVIFLCSWKPK